MTRPPYNDFAIFYDPLSHTFSANAREITPLPFPIPTKKKSIKKEVDMSTPIDNTIDYHKYFQFSQEGRLILFPWNENIREIHGNKYTFTIDFGACSEDYVTKVVSYLQHCYLVYKEEQGRKISGFYGKMFRGKLQGEVVKKELPIYLSEAQKISIMEYVGSVHVRASVTINQRLNMLRDYIRGLSYPSSFADTLEEIFFSALRKDLYAELHESLKAGDTLLYTNGAATDTLCNFFKKSNVDSETLEHYKILDVARQSNKTSTDIRTTIMNFYHVEGTGGNFFKLTTQKPPVSVSTPQEPTKVRLKHLMPNFKKQLKEVKSNFIRSGIGQVLIQAGKDKTPPRLSPSTLNILWGSYNNFKISLMLLGYSEYEAAVFLTKTLFKHHGKLTYPIDVGECMLTRQLLPTFFLVEVKMLSGEVIMANLMYIINIRNHRSETSMYSYNSEAKLWVQNKLKPIELYDLTVHQYNYNALTYLSPRQMPSENTKVFGGDKIYNPVPFFGIELEVERANKVSTEHPSGEEPDCPENITESCYDVLGRDYVILKRDGTLRGYKPFEIVTVPATLAYHKKRWDGFLSSKAKDGLQSFKSGNCGMHVHISRSAFTGLHLAKFMRFINEPINRNFITIVAQRAGNTYTQYSDLTLMQHSKALHAHIKYGAVNTRNQNTIEVRIFRGNLARIGFLKNIEFVHAAYMYTKDCGLNNLKYTDFLLWLYNPINDTKDYKHLKSWLVSKGFLASNKPIRKNTPEDVKLKLLERQKVVNKTQQVLRRRFKPDQSTIPIGSREPVSRDVITSVV